MARTITYSFEVTDEEFANFLARTSGADGRKITPQTATAESDDENEAPAADAPAVDKNNVAWHATYHSSSKALNADGTWRRRKGMTDVEKAAADTYDKSETVVVDAPDGTPVTMELPVTPAPVAMPGMPGLPVAAQAPTPVTYEEVVALFGQAVTKDPTVSANFNELYAKAGVTNPQTLTTDEGAEQRIKLAGLLAAILAT